MKSKKQSAHLSDLNVERLAKKEIQLWFSKRKLENRDYQVDAIYDTERAINGEPVILNICPGGGKTICSIVAIERFLKTHPGTKVIVLAHGQKMLREQYAANLRKHGPDFKWQIVEEGSPCLNSDVDVYVTLPQTFHRRKLAHLVGALIIVDEAHHYFNGKMVQKIVSQVKPKHIVLLTGTPSPFISRGWPLIVVPMSRLLGKYLGNVSVELAESEYVFGIDDMNDQQEVLNRIDYNKKDTNKTLDNLLAKVKQRLSLNGNWEKVAEGMCKTMFVCRKISQAKDVFNYFNAKGISVVISDSKSDETGDKVQEFIDDDSHTMLVVVNRGVLGFDYHKLCNVIDLSGTGNPDRLYQLMSRLVRPHEEKHNHKKVFFKVVPVELKLWYQAVMNAALFLIDEEGIRKYNGTNFKDMLVLTRDIVETDLISGKQFSSTGGEHIVIKDKIPNKKGPGYSYNIDVLKSDGTVKRSRKLISVTDVFEELGTYLPSKGSGRDTSTTEDKWKKKRMRQIPLDLVSFDFFVKSLAKHKKVGIYARSTVEAVKRSLGYLRSTGMTYEEVLDRFKKILELEVNA